MAVGRGSERRRLTGDLVPGMAVGRRSERRRLTRHLRPRMGMRLRRVERGRVDDIVPLNRLIHPCTTRAKNLVSDRGVGRLDRTNRVRVRRRREHRRLVQNVRPVRHATGAGNTSPSSIATKERGVVGRASDGQLTNRVSVCGRRERRRLASDLRPGRDRRELPAPIAPKELRDVRCVRR